MPFNPTKNKAWEKEWKGWSKFGCGGRYNFLEFNEAKKFLKKYKVKTQQEFFKLRKRNNEIKEKFPVAPYDHYKFEWKDWADFLGNGKIKIEYLSYQEAEKVVQKYGVQCREEFLELKRKDIIEFKQISTSADVHYKKQWKGWTKFFGKNHNHGNFLSYKESSRKAQEIKIERAEDYLKLAIAHKLPKGMPRSPRQFYQREWKDWYDFLGKEKPFTMNYQDTSKVAQKLGIKSSIQYISLYDLGKLPKGMPRNPRYEFRRKK